MDGTSGNKRRGAEASVDGRPREVSTSTRQPQQRKAVPPGYLHDLLHSRHLMKTVGLRRQSNDRNMIASSLKRVQTSTRNQGGLKQKRVTKTGTPTLPELFQQRKRFLDRRKDRKEKNKRTSDKHRIESANGDPASTGLLSLPEELLLKIVCSLTHEEATPLFLVCKELNLTLRNAIKFHFNFAAAS
jgi:hypothetical protein